MKDRKTLNKLLFGIILVCSSIVFIYAIVSGIMTSGGAPLWTFNGAISGTVLLFMIFTLAAIIARMVLVTVPTLKNNANKTMAIGALLMDILALIGIVFLLSVFILGHLERRGSISSGEIPATICILLGAPFLFIGQIVAYKFSKSAFKVAK